MLLNNDKRKNFKEVAFSHLLVKGLLYGQLLLLTRAMVFLSVYCLRTHRGNDFILPPTKKVNLCIDFCFHQASGVANN